MTQAELQGIAKRLFFLDSNVFKYCLNVQVALKNKEVLVKSQRKNLHFISILFFPENEFLDIAVKLKPHVERRMKIEPFPWLRGLLRRYEQIVHRVNTRENRK